MEVADSCLGCCRFLLWCMDGRDANGTERRYLFENRDFRKLTESGFVISTKMVAMRRFWKE
ncbi:hypothetical protein PRECH8_19490 [Insulibacter thermoxylanivorax]|uniref:Uncharacterized protein n=1 Tax=Insulibacter thermoxylanivorax TaxID=2749268 RepID=A0A916QFV0_9BACL|nr:hypothetical protein PRECH8_19490 [Insulibacter thermoxylanivorax]